MRGEEDGGVSNFFFGWELLPLGVRVSRRDWICCVIPLVNSFVFETPFVGRGTYGSVVYQIWAFVLEIFR